MLSQRQRVRRRRNRAKKRKMLADERKASKEFRRKALDDYVFGSMGAFGHSDPTARRAISHLMKEKGGA